MARNNKRTLIGILLAVIAVMAVAYAAFGASLNVNSTANITSSWNVGFDTTKTSGADVISATAGISGGTAPTGTITSLTATSAQITTSLVQPGDSVTYTFTVKNSGTLNATLTQPTLTEGNSSNAYVSYSKTNFASTALNAGASTTFTVTVTYKSTATGTPGTSTNYTATVTFGATQAS